MLGLASFFLHVPIAARVNPVQDFVEVLCHQNKGVLSSRGGIRSLKQSGFAHGHLCLSKAELWVFEVRLNLICT